MERYKLNLAYDGSRYKGFQRQSNQRNVQTVQCVIEEALAILGWRGSTVTAAGRTDTGVHALGQVIAMDMDWKHTLKSLQNAINALLPQDIVVRSIAKVGKNFHPRFDAIARSYRYHIYCSETRNPLLDRFAWRVWPELNVKKINKAIHLFVGTYDFSAFGKDPNLKGSKIRSVMVSEWSSWEHGMDVVGWRYDIKANSFLYRMIRRIVFLLVKIGHSKVDGNTVVELLKYPPAKTIQGLAPACGLVLMDVFYPNEINRL